MRIKNTGTSRASFTFEGVRYGLDPQGTVDFGDEKGPDLLEEIAKLPQLVAAYGVGGEISAVGELVDGAPGALDTLNELAQALDDDAGFAETVNAAINGKRDAAPSDLDMGAFKIYSSEPDASIRLEPNGTGAVFAESPLSTPGDARGVAAADFQLAKTDAANVASGQCSFLGGGADNRAAGPGSAAVGGQGNKAYGDSSVVAGGQGNTAWASAPSLLMTGVGNEAGDFLADRFAGNNLVGGSSNKVNGLNSLVAGVRNEVNSARSTTPAGQWNKAGLRSETTSGTFYQEDAVVAGGSHNVALATSSAVGGGNYNSANGPADTIGGGQSNSTLGGGQATVSGGTKNVAAGTTATVAGGTNNYVAGNNSFAMGANNVATAAAGTSQALGAANWNSASVSVAIGQGNHAAHNNATALGRGGRTSADFELALANHNQNDRIPDAVCFRAGGASQEVHVGRTTDQPSADSSQGVTITPGAPATLTAASTAIPNGSIVTLATTGALPASFTQNVVITTPTPGNYIRSFPRHLFQGVATFTVGTPERTSCVFSQPGTFYDVSGPAKAIQLYDGAGAGHYFWFRVLGGSNTQTDPALVGTGHEVDVDQTDSPEIIAFWFHRAVRLLYASFAVNNDNPTDIRVANIVPGAVTDASATGSAAAVSVLTQGAAGTPVDNGLLCSFTPSIAGSPAGLAPASNNYYVVNSTGTSFNLAVTPGGTPIQVGGFQDILSGISGNGGSPHTMTFQGLTAGTRYVVVNSSGLTFQLSYALNGPGIPLYSAGTGTHTATRRTLHNASATNRVHLHTTNPGFQSKSVSIKAPTDLTADVSLVLPATAGQAGQVLSSDGAGLLSWVDPSPTQTRDVTVLPADVLALDTTPVQLVPAPAAGMLIVVESVESLLDFGSTAYASAAALAARYAGAGSDIVEVAGSDFLTGSSDQRRLRVAYADAPGLLAADAAVELHASGAISLGDSPIKLRVKYRTVAPLS
jgi:hypothetical protein